MSTRARVGLVILWVASLVAVAALARAQTQMTPLDSPFVLSGSDVGFRVSGRIGNTPAGGLVIRVNGQWIVPREGGTGAHLAPGSR